MQHADRDPQPEPARPERTPSTRPPALDARLASAIGNRAFARLAERSRRLQRANKDEGSLTLPDIARSNMIVIEEYGLAGWATDPRAARRLQELREQEQESARAAPPTVLDKAKALAAEGYLSTAEYLAATRVGKAAKRLDEDLKETARNVAGEGFDETLGGIQQAQKRRYGADVDFATTPRALGEGVGELGYESAKSYAEGKLLSVAGALIPTGGKWKLKWNRAEADAAAHLWKTEAKLTWREAEIWIDQGGKLVKTARRLDAVGVDLTAGTIEAIEWSTEKQLAESARKQAQLELQRKLFAEAREKGWRVLAKPHNEGGAYFDITEAVERTEAYPHFRKRKP